jgi:hypothetical protein
MDGKGTYRTRGIGNQPDTARVVDRSVAFDLPEIQYRRRGYEPDFEELGWAEKPKPEGPGEGKGIGGSPRGRSV